MTSMYLKTRFPTKPCAACGGCGGRVHPTGWEECNLCSGTKKIQQIEVYKAWTCIECEGYGDIEILDGPLDSHNEACDYCCGYGYVEHNPLDN